jgi:hypothetical protein
VLGRRVSASSMAARSKRLEVLRLADEAGEGVVVEGVG